MAIERAYGAVDWLSPRGTTNAIRLAVYGTNTWAKLKHESLLPNSLVCLLAPLLAGRVMSCDVMVSDL